MAQAIYEYFHGRDTLFEACAARLWQLIAPAVAAQATPRRRAVARLVGALVALVVIARLFATG